MLNRKIIYTIIISLAILAIILAGIIFYSQKNDLRVVFFDVGQGDAILVSQGSNQLLIDGGKDGKVLLEKMGRYVPFWDRSIEAVVATHPDQDHIGGLINLLKAYRVQNVLKTNAESDSQTFKKLEEEITNNNVQKVEAKKDLKINFPNGAVAEVLYPSNSLPSVVDANSNDNSVVLKISYGENSFLLTGDLPSTEEQVLISDELAKNSLNSKILKVSHHGSKYATSDEFLDAVKPQDAIISVGKNNSYGHPKQEVLDRFLKYKTDVLRTDEVGDIEYVCKSLSSLCTVVN